MTRSSSLAFAALVLTNCASTTPAQRATALLDAFDTWCLDTSHDSKATLLAKTNKDTTVASVPPRASVADVPVLHDNTARISVHWRPGGYEGRDDELIRCVLAGANVDDALLVRGLLERLRPRHQWVNRSWGRNSRVVIEAIWLIDPQTSPTSITTSGTWSNDGVSHALSTSAVLELLRPRTMSPREYVDSWPDMPGAGDALEDARTRFIANQKERSRQLNQQAQKSAEFWSRVDAEQRAATERAIVGGISDAMKAIARDGAREQQQRDFSARAYDARATGTAIAPASSTWRPVAMTKPANQKPTSPTRKPVCRLGSARTCDNGFKVGVVEYDCSNPGSKRQAETAYSKQLIECEKPPPKQGAKQDDRTCRQRRSQCLDRCTKSASTCEKPPYFDPGAAPGREPDKYETLWVELQRDGETSPDELGWLPSRALAESQAWLAARNRAAQECSTKFGDGIAGQIRHKEVQYPGNCESKPEMGTTVWNCRAAVKVTCYGEKQNPAYTAWVDRTRAQKEHTALVERFDRCVAQEKSRNESCENQCTECR